jgi:hypothetical protein
MTRRAEVEGVIKADFNQFFYQGFTNLDSILVNYITTLCCPSITAVVKIDI